MSINAGKSPPTIPSLALACWVLKSHKLNFLPAETELDKEASGALCQKEAHTHSLKTCQ